MPNRQLPNWLLRIAALRDPAIKRILPDVGKVKNATNEKAKRLLGWVPRSNEEAIVATAESLDNIMVGDGTSPLRVLAEHGVARVSYGPGPYLMAMKSLEERARAATV